MLKQIWHTIKCRVSGHPYDVYGTTYELDAVDYTGFFASGVYTIQVVKCSNCKAILGRTR